MQGFIFYFKIGWSHIISLSATDHLYFIAVLSILYQLADWKKVLVLVTAFTIGHAITLYLSALDLFRFSVEWVEFVIPCTIVITAAKNLLMPAQSKAGNKIQYAMALGFGLVHGMGYANYIRMMLSSDQQLVWSLFSFNIGLEIGQIFVVLVVLLISWILHRYNVISQRLLVMLFSLMVMGLSLFMAYQRIPFFNKNPFMKQVFIIAFFLVSCSAVFAQPLRNPGSNHGNRFEQLDYLMQDPNEYRTASGAPGPKYWQQRADYDINVDINEEENLLTGSETVTYFNNSPDVLTYIWLQIDENFHHPNSDNNYDKPSAMSNRLTHQQLLQMNPKEYMKGFGVNITALTDATGKPLSYTVNQTMMRVDLPIPLKSGQKFVFKVNWNYRIPDKLTRYGRGGYEYFAEDGNNLYSITQWFPRLAVYSDFQGWQNLQFAGGAEFALTFGNYKVNITVPEDHIVASTGECKNLAAVLTADQLARWQKAQTSAEPIEIVTLAEAIENSKDKSKGKKTWIYEAQNVRDFAFNTSRRLVWDAMAADVEGKKVMCMSYYGKEAYPLYRKYSTKAVYHTIKTYSKFTIPYPYPVAISVEASIGMEYPMLAMNFGRAEKDGTYSESVKYGAIGVIIHEVGHNFFPMIVNSDERQYWWMDEGLNTFCQFLTEQEFDNNYPSRRGPAHLITDYMKLPKDLLEPIMTKGDNVANVGSNAYAKAATGLNILRETIMGRELFDYAFKEYAKRWAFRHPTPYDLFRTMEDASAVDLDWFWRGWYYGTEPVDISLDSVKWFKLDAEKNLASMQSAEFESISKIRNRNDKKISYYTDADTTLRDFYYYNRSADVKMYQDMAQQQLDAQKDRENYKQWEDKNLYELSFTNKGGMVMPIIVEWTFKDGSKEVDRIPVTIWRLNEQKVTKLFVKDKEVSAIKLDPMRETSDINEANGMWPVRELPSRYQLFKGASAISGLGAPRGGGGGQNAMQKAQKK